MAFDGRLAAGTESYRAFRQSWAGCPRSEVPAIAVVRGAVGGRAAATVYASYNGCTDVAGWVVLGGPSPGKLTGLGRARRLGFETAIDVPAAPACLAVEAIGSAGRVLARSGAQPAR